MESLVKSAVDAIVLDTVSHQMDHSNHGDHANHGSGSTSSDMSGMMHEAMSPYLFANMKDFFVLFREAKVTNGGGLAGAIVASIVFALLATMFSLYSKVIEGKSANSSARFSAIAIAATLAFAFRMFLHYITMLLVMTMNVWIILAVVVGHAFGFLIYNVSFVKTKSAGDGEACDC